MKVQIYEPNKQLKLGIKIWKEMFLELFEFRELIWRLFIRDLSGKHKQSVLGNVWAIVMPFVAIGTLADLVPLNFMNLGQDASYGWAQGKYNENTVNLKGEVELIVTKMDAKGAMLFIRP